MEVGRRAMGSQSRVLGREAARSSLSMEEKLSSCFHVKKTGEEQAQGKARPEGGHGREREGEGRGRRQGQGREAGVGAGRGRLPQRWGCRTPWSLQSAGSQRHRGRPGGAAGQHHRARLPCASHMPGGPSRAPEAQQRARGDEQGGRSSYARPPLRPGELTP